MQSVYIHPTADVSPRATLGPGTKVWHQAQVREGAVLGRNCILGTGAYVDFDVHIGDNVKIQNRASIYHGVTLEDGVFVGPHAIFTNDKLPRAVNRNSSLKHDDDWELGRFLVKECAFNDARPIMGEEEKAAVIAVLESGQLAQGNVVANFERAFAEYCGVKHGIATTNGTTALHAAVLANELGEGDEVITAPFTFIASANSI